jgi:uncharacterized membrane protein
MGCKVQTENSSSTDAALYRSVAGGSAQFNAARLVMQNNCINCHGYSSMTESQLKAAGLVIAGNPEDSPIYYRLVGSGGSNSPKDMPVGGAITANELEAVRIWIQNLP